MKRAERTRDGDSTLALDDRHFPLAISKWFNKPTKLLATSYFDWLGLMIERAEFYDTKVVQVIDASHVDLPEPDARRFLAQGAARLAEQFKGRDTLARTFITPPSDVIRKILTVVRWSLDIEVPIVMATSLDGALGKALAAFEPLGVDGPTGLNRQLYRLDEDVVRMLPDTSGTSFRIVPDKDGKKRG